MVNSIQPFETKRLRFRDWFPEDLPEFKKMNLDPRVCRYFRNLISEESTERFYVNTIQAQFSQYGWGLYAVETLSDREFIGFIGFHKLVIDAEFSPCIEIGWRLKPSAWGLGYATEGAMACLQQGFETLGFDEVYCNTPVLNVPSENVMKRIGLQKTGEFFYPGFPEDSPLRKHVLYYMNREIYETRKRNDSV